jgi:Fic family protein
LPQKVAKTWNWQQDDWPHFRFDPKRLEPLEAAFLRESGVFAGTFRHVREDDVQRLTVEILSEEAIESSEIEGEILNRDSVQSSIRRNLGLADDHRKVETRRGRDR